jgi:hypothetical protein
MQLLGGFSIVGLANPDEVEFASSPNPFLQLGPASNKLVAPDDQLVRGRRAGFWGELRLHIMRQSLQDLCKRDLVFYRAFF